MKKKKHQTSAKASMYGYFAGTLVGTMFIALPMFIGLLLSGPTINIQGISILLFFVFFVVLVVGAGLLVLGMPVWFLLHKLGLVSWWSAIVAGAFLPAVTMFWTAGELNVAAVFACWGTVVGLTVWYVAYVKKWPSGQGEGMSTENQDPHKTAIDIQQGQPQ